MEGFLELEMERGERRRKKRKRAESLGVGDWGTDEGWLESQASSCNCQGGTKGISIMSLVPWLVKAQCGAGE